jgi:hypothetical protein
MNSSRTTVAPSLPARFVRWVGIAALAIGCAGLLGGAAEAASCSHYVKRLGPGFVPGKAAAEKVAAAEAAHRAPSQSPCGCRGPECHSSPSNHVPASPAAPHRLIVQQELVSIAGCPFQVEMASHRLASDLFGRPSRGYPLGTSRPPCA